MASRLLHTVMPSGGDFTSLDAAIDHLVASHADLVTADVYADVEISGSWSSADTSAVTISGITTDATRYLNIYTTGTARHLGKWDTGKYILGLTSDKPIYAYCNNIRINGLQIEITLAAPNAAYGIYLHDMIEGTSYITHNIIRVSGSSANDGYGFRCLTYGSGTHATNFWNNNIYGFYCNIRTDAPTANIYNNTIIKTGGSVYGIWTSDGTVIASNNIVNGFGDSYTYVGTFSADSRNNATDSTDDIGAGSGHHTGHTFTFVDSANGDYHLASNDTGAIDLGVDLSAIFTTDIDGVTRSGTWDIGADEYVAAGAPSSTLARGIAVGMFKGMGIGSGQYP